MDGRPARRGDARELGGEVELVLRQRPLLVEIDVAEVLDVVAVPGAGILLIGDEPRACEVGLLRPDQPDLVDQPRQHANRVGPAREAEQIDPVARRILLDQKQ